MRRKTLTRTRRTRKRRLLAIARVALLRGCAFACRSVSRRGYRHIGPFMFVIARWAQ